MNPDRVLYATAGVLAGAGLFLRLLPTPLPAAERRSLALPPPPGAREASPPPSTVYGPIATADMFSIRREPPRARFVPVGSAHPVVVGPPHHPGPRLYGITVGPEGSVAVISTDPGVVRAELYQVGDTLLGARVVAITESTVTLARPSGSFTLHLAFPGEGPR